MFRVFGREACGIIAPWSEIELESEHLTTEPAGDSWNFLTLKWRHRTSYEVDTESFVSYSAHQRIISHSHGTESIPGPSNWYKSLSTRLQILFTCHHFLHYKALWVGEWVGGWIPSWLIGKEYAWQRRRREFIPWAGKDPWRRAWQPTPGFLPGESHGQRSLADYGLWGHTKSDMSEGSEHTQANVCLCRRINLGFCLRFQWVIFPLAFFLVIFH